MLHRTALESQSATLKRAAFAASLLLLSASLSACGQKGPLLDPIEQEQQALQQPAASD
ncbi:LPS translocon maturation chaperone LptM [Agaribacterium haliotis]|uniref:LPS translocon maturation chaperone LptM n=1 Tax=Agaribacterium haliotis TaxID=2013869 RepID=UPI001177CFF3|nr:lipoprotein [Agaribacterium haliotis]